MGVTWSLEIISFFLPLNYLWYITDTANALHGVLIFVIFVLKRKVIMETNNYDTTKVESWRNHDFVKNVKRSH